MLPGHRNHIASDKPGFIRRRRRKTRDRTGQGGPGLARVLLQRSGQPGAFFYGAQRSEKKHEPPRPKLTPELSPTPVFWRQPKNTTGRTEGRLAGPGHSLGGRGNSNSKSGNRSGFPDGPQPRGKCSCARPPARNADRGRATCLFPAPGHGPRSRSVVVGFPWWASGGRPPRLPDPARAAISGPRFGGSLVGVHPSIFGPLGRTGERSPGLVLRVPKASGVLAWLFRDFRKCRLVGLGFRLLDVPGLEPFQGNHTDKGSERNMICLP